MDLFLICFRNLYIRNYIIKYLRLYNNTYRYSYLANFKYPNQLNTLDPFSEYITHLNLVSIFDPKGLSLKSIKYTFPNLEHLLLPSIFNDVIKVQDFGNRLKSIVFGDDFNNESFSSTGNENNGLVLPMGLEKVEFGFKFNKEISKGTLPSSLKSLVFGYSWNLALDKLNIPDQLEILKFGRGFERKLGGVKLPSGLKSLVIKSNVVIHENVLPIGLKELRLLDKYNSPFKTANVIPSTLEYLEVGNSFNQDLSIALSSLKSLRVLRLGDEYNIKLRKGSLPPSLTNIEFGNYVHLLEPGVIPHSVTDITFKDSFSDKRLLSILVPGSLPPVVEFKMGHYFNIPIAPSVLPSTIKSLNFSDNFKTKLEDYSIPSSVEKLVFCSDFNQNLPILPSSLKILKLGHSFKKKLNIGSLPYGLTYLSMSSYEF
ncbi:hypothetical protein DICPUDRAFT_33573, partial [Dictyostelium purpureum]